MIGGSARQGYGRPAAPTRWRRLAIRLALALLTAALFAGCIAEKLERPPGPGFDAGDYSDTAGGGSVDYDACCEE